VSFLSCEVWAIIYWILKLFWLAMLLYALVSWVPSLQGRWSSYLARIVEPVLLPLRRIIPPLGGFDMSFLVVIILVGVVMNQIPGAGNFQYCSAYN
jgi:YggT family protein